MSGSEHTLLSVDDDDHFRNGIRSLLRRLRKEIRVKFLEARSGTDAMTVLHAHDVDCVLLDYRMPGGTGLEWLEKMLERPRPPAVIMVTGEGSETVAVEAMKLGAVDYLVKGSITRESFYRSVRNAIDAMEMRRTIDRQRETLLEAERHRVMVESLGAACHHLGQPAAVITVCLEMLRRDNQPPETLTMINQALEAAAAMKDILERFHSVSEYRTVPYCPMGGDSASRADGRILDV